MFTLGQLFFQESIIISSNNKIKLIFTSGLNFAKAYFADQFDTSIDKNFSLIPYDKNSDNNNNDDNLNYIIIGQYNFDYDKLNELQELENMY